MEKLIELLNEYMPNMKREERHNWTEIFTNIHNSDLFICYTERVISNRFGFIKRLVDNDKIDLHLAKYDFEEYSEEEKALMCLAIQENPIDFLVSILK